MRLSKAKVDSLCKERNVRIRELLERAGVSRNAFYSVARRKSVVPWSLIRIAEHLEVPVSSLLEETPTPFGRMKKLSVETRRILKKHPDCDRANVRQTLLLLDEKPVERLRRVLIRGTGTLIFGERRIEFLRELIRQKVEFMMVGLSAAALQGAPVVTRSVELWFRTLHDPGIERALKKVKGRYIPPTAGNPPIFTGDSLELYDIVTHVKGLGWFNEEAANAIKIPLGRFKVPALKLERIIAGRKAAGRKKDEPVLKVLTDALKTIRERK